MSTIIFAISFIYIWIIVFIYPPWHKVLRTANVYKTLLVTSILLSLLSFLSYDPAMEKSEKDMVFAASHLMLFLILYKVYDNYLLRIQKRHIFFYVKFNSVWKDNESDASSFVEGLMQFSLVIIPLVVCYFFRWIVIDLL